MSATMAKKPQASSPLVSRTMKKVRVRDTEEEMAVRRLLFARGLRYRVQYRPKSPNIGRSSIDIAFPRQRIAVFIDGCFWHGCPVHGAVPKANKKWWANKLMENRSSDSRVTTVLEGNGWTVLRFWTHESPESIATHIEEAVKESDLEKQSLS
jgi:DNA mismatch endonuclease (patch repair protein)